MTNYILFLAYGHDEIFHECKFALLRLLTIYDEGAETPEIIIYTDRPAAFDLFKDRLIIHIQQIDKEKIEKWRGTINFSHRVKIEMLIDCMAKYHGKLLYADCDTYCLQRLDALFEAISATHVFLHAHEGSIMYPDNIHFRKWRTFLRRQTKSGLSSALQTDMWNAGAIGMMSEHAVLLAEVLKITDEVFPKFRRHTVEQFAFCHVFHKNGLHISGAKRFLFHYWNLKEFRKVLRLFFNKYDDAPIRVQMEKSITILPELILPDKLAYERISSFKRRIIKLKKKEWIIDPYFQLIER